VIAATAAEIKAFFLEYLMPLSMCIINQIKAIAPTIKKKMLKNAIVGYQTPNCIFIQFRIYSNLPLL